MLEGLIKNRNTTIWNSEQPTAGTNKDYGISPGCRYLGVALQFPGAAPSSIVLNIQGSNNGVNFTTLNSLSAAGTVVSDVGPFRIVRFNLATFTGPQNIIVTAIPRV
jgi:hypothetical protein